MMRHALTLLDREELVANLRELQDMGDAAVAAGGLTESDLEAVLREVSDKPEGELDDRLNAIVQFVSAGATSPDRPTRRAAGRAPLPVVALSEQAPTPSR